jgi:K+-sensing histidine kinase KdpD
VPAPSSLRVTLRYPIAGEGFARRRARALSLARTTSAYSAGLAVVAASTLTAWWVFGPSDLADVVMVRLLGVVVVAIRFGYGPSLVAALLSALAVEVFFLPPYFSLTIANMHHVVTFGVMLVVAFVISHLAQSVRRQSETARRASLMAQTEQLRNALLSSVSHDLRTPLAVITGATSAMLAEHAPRDEASRRALLETAHREAQLGPAVVTHRPPRNAERASYVAWRAYGASASS